MAKAMDYDRLLTAVKGHAAGLRSKSKQQPAGGAGTKVFPPTYAGAVYATEERRLPGHEAPVPCVLLDSVQSQANRMEEALQEALDRGQLGNAGLPIVEVDFTPFYDPEEAALPDKKRGDTDLLDPVGRITSLQAPHRIADAILRDSMGEDGTPFRNTAEGQRIGQASLQNATPLLELCPTALLFGLWDSTGPKGGLGAKFERAIVSEIVGIHAVYGVSVSSRVDPALQKNPPLYETESGDWTACPEEAVTITTRSGKDKKKAPKPYRKKVSEINHGNVTPDFGRYSSKNFSNENRETVDVMRSDGDYIKGGRIKPGGVTIDHAEHSVVISLAALRRLRFPLNGVGSYDPRDPEQHARDDAARAVLAALGLLASTLATSGGMDLRSRCLLWPPEESAGWQLLAGPGKTEDFTPDVDGLVTLYNDAVKAATDAGLPWRTEPLVLRPSDQLVKLVVKSQNLAAKSGEGDDGEEA